MKDTNTNWIDVLGFFNGFRLRSKPPKAITDFLYLKYSEAITIRGDFYHSEDLTKYWFEPEKDHALLKSPNTGIYFLRLDSFVTYVGMSKELIEKRIEEHLNEKIFNNIKAIDLSNVKPDVIQNIEYYYINLFNPPGNIQDNYGYYKHLLPSKYLQDIKQVKIDYQDFNDLRAMNIAKKAAQNPFFQ